MYLSRLRLDPKSRAVRRDLSDCHDLHRTVMSGFDDGLPEGAARAQAGVLHRVEETDGALVLYVQSRERPDWSRLPDDYLAADWLDDNPAVRPLGSAWEGLTAGQELRFRLRANPTRKVDTKTGPDGSRRNGRRVPVVGDEALVAWLARKAQAGGFRLLATRVQGDVADTRVVEARPLRGTRPAADGAARALTFAAVVFEGRLAITDPDAFRQTLASGIGSAKAYGFGLLSIAPPR